MGLSIILSACQNGLTDHKNNDKKRLLKYEVTD